jgi:hypothetical protein
MSKKPAPAEGQSSEQTGDLAGSPSHGLFGWVNAAERLPETTDPVALLAVHEDGGKSIAIGIFQASWDDDELERGWYRVNNQDDFADPIYGNVTHWIPLPNDEHVHHYQRRRVSIMGLGL